MVEALAHVHRLCSLPSSSKGSRQGAGRCASRWRPGTQLSGLRPPPPSYLRKQLLQTLALYTSNVFSRVCFSSSQSSVLRDPRPEPSECVPARKGPQTSLGEAGTPWLWAQGFPGSAQGPFFPPLSFHCCSLARTPRPPMSHSLKSAHTASEQKAFPDPDGKQ